MAEGQCSAEKVAVKGSVQPDQALNPDGRYRPTLVENGGYNADRLISAVMPTGKGPVTTFLVNVLIHTSLMHQMHENVPASQIHPV